MRTIAILGAIYGAFFYVWPRVEPHLRALSDPNNKKKDDNIPKAKGSNKNAGGLHGHNISNYDDEDFSKEDTMNDYESPEELEKQEAIRKSSNGLRNR